MGESGYAEQVGPPPSQTTGEVVQAVARGAISAIPVFGGPAAELLGLVLQPAFARRRRVERLRAMRRLAALALIALASAGCIGSSSGGAAQTIRVKPRVGEYRYQIDRGVSTGDTIRCVQGQHAVLTAVVPGRGHGVGNAAGFAVSVRRSGLVEILCPALVGTK